jgi:flagellar hook-basal body complex protein FliE
MSNVEINKVLAQMRTLANGLEPNQGPAQSGQPDFGAVMKQAIEKVSDQQSTAANLVSAFETGSSDASLSEVMISMQKASVSFQAMTEVRNRLIDAYHEVMNMPI